MSHHRAVAVVAALIAAAGDVRAAPDEPPHRAIAVIESCGAPLPAFLANAADLPIMFAVEPARFIEQLVAGQIRDIASFCSGSAKQRKALQTKISAICFVGAAGTDDPLLYVAGRMLVVESGPWEYQRSRFRTALARAVARGSVTAPSEDCAAALNPPANNRHN